MKSEETDEPPSVEIDILRQVAITDFQPTDEQFHDWVMVTLAPRMSHAILAIVTLSQDGISEYNTKYRHINKATNVLSFPHEDEFDDDENQLGDLLMCPDIINQEAAEHNLSPVAHWAHITVHGLLHLLGYDHESDSDAELMESEEIRILAQLGYSNPYLALSEEQSTS